MHPMLSVNKVKVAVKRAGGPTRVGIILGCSGTAVHSWIRKRKIPNIIFAEKLAKIADMDLRELRPCR
jgi:hypothetical protein